MKKKYSMPLVMAITVCGNRQVLVGSTGGDPGMARTPEMDINDIGF